jgi:hypothetical protein
MLHSKATFQNMPKQVQTPIFINYTKSGSGPLVQAGYVGKFLPLPTSTSKQQNEELISAKPEHTF